MIIVAPGSLSDGFTTSVLPVTVANAADQSTILPFISLELHVLSLIPHSREVERRDACADA